MTTITIDEEIKEDLLKIAAHLQIKMREKVNYNTTIKYLIDHYQKKKDAIKFREACKKVENINVNDVLEELYSERMKDEISL